MIGEGLIAGKNMTDALAYFDEIIEDSGNGLYEFESKFSAYLGKAYFLVRDYVKWFWIWL